MNVSGRKLTTRRSTLTTCPDSVLATQFDAETWGSYGDGGGGGGGTSPGRGGLSAALEGDDSDDEGVFIESSPYCFAKIVDQLRLMAMATAAGDPPPPPPLVAVDEAANIRRMARCVSIG